MQDTNNGPEPYDPATCLLDVRIVHIGGNRLSYENGDAKRLVMLRGHLQERHGKLLPAALTSVILYAPRGHPSMGWSGISLDRNEHPGCCGGVHFQVQVEKLGDHQVTVGLDMDHTTLDTFLRNLEHGLALNPVHLYLSLGLGRYQFQDFEFGNLDLRQDYPIQSFQLMA